MTVVDNRHQPATDRGEHWTARARCKGTSEDLWFPTRANTPAAYTAARFCHTRPVRAECLTSATREPHTSGIRGGHYFDEGKHRPIGEPDPYRLGGAQRSQLAAARRREALTLFHQLRAGLPSNAEGYRALAAHFGVTEGCAREWIKVARADLTRELERAEKGVAAP